MARIKISFPPPHPANPKIETSAATEEATSPPCSRSVCASITEIAIDLKNSERAYLLKERIDSVFTVIQNKINEYLAEKSPRRKAMLRAGISLADTYLDLIEFDRVNRKIGSQYVYLSERLITTLGTIETE